MTLLSLSLSLSLSLVCCLNQKKQLLLLCRPLARRRRLVSIWKAFGFSQSKENRGNKFRLRKTGFVLSSATNKPPVLFKFLDFSVSSIVLLNSQSCVLTTALNTNDFYYRNILRVVNCLLFRMIEAETKREGKKKSTSSRRKCVRPSISLAERASPTSRIQTRRL